jgi:alpha-amylase
MNDFDDAYEHGDRSPGKAISLYLHVHQPYRVRPYTIFDVATKHDYFDDRTADALTNNEFIINKVAEKSYLPTNQRLLKLLHDHPEFRLSLSITGTVIRQLEEWAPHVLDSFRQLTDTGRVEIVGETYHHSLAFFYSRQEFEAQVKMHKEKVEAVFGQTPRVFRNTELAYNNDLAHWADQNGYKAILAEGWDKVLDWRSANFVYRPAGTHNVRLLMKNYRLSDDIAFRFGDRDWSGWPLTADKFAHWLNDTHDAQVFNLFMDYETFGEHQWQESGIFDFLEHLPEKWLAQSGNRFLTVSEAADAYEPVDEIDVPDTITWADTERDLSAWLGNSLQTSAISKLYELGDKIMDTHDLVLIEDWRRLQTSDHFYYMCTKWFNDGDIHAYFSPYDNPYDAFIAYMNTYNDLRWRLLQKGVEL